MSDTITETEALARQLWALYTEALGYMASAETGWDDLTPPEQEAWRQLSQWVAARDTTVASRWVSRLFEDEPDHR